MGAKPRAFKHQLGPKQVGHIAAALTEASPQFDGSTFRRRANTGLGQMELKARVAHVIDGLRGALPQPFPRALAVIVAAVERDRETRRLRGFTVWPLIDYIGEHGLADPELSLEALRRLTGRFSAEFAIRPFIDRFPEATLARLRSWTDDPDEHVRRLVSEGSRPLLPWGRRLHRFRSDPSPVLELLELLQKDSSEYVRRSVANNLNDIAKDHPGLVVDLCRRWMDEADDRTVALVRRALRSLIKAGDPAALAVLGFDANVAVDVGAIDLSPEALAEGESVELCAEIVSTAGRDQRLNIDYAVHYVKASGKRSAKVFKLKTLRLGPGAAAVIRKKHSMKRVTTRVHYPGVHTIELLVNGVTMGSADFELVSGSGRSS